MISQVLRLLANGTPRPHVRVQLYLWLSATLSAAHIHVQEMYIVRGRAMHVFEGGACRGVQSYRAAFDGVEDANVL